METANPASFRYMNSMISDSSGVISDCNSDHSGELIAAPVRRALRHTSLSSFPDDDDAVPSLVADLSSPSIDVQRRAAMELRHLAKHDLVNRLRIARAGAVRPLVALMSHPDPHLQEHGVTAVLNLCLHKGNRGPAVAAGVIRALARAVRSGATPAARENAACALVRLAQGGEHRAAIGRSGAIPALVELLEAGGPRGRKDAATALYTVCTGEKENKARAVEAGVVRVLLEMMSDPESGMVDTAAYVLAAVVEEGRKEVVEEGGVAVLVEMLEVGTQRQNEIAAEVLLEICVDDVGLENRAAVAREGAIPPLVALSQCCSSKSKKKVQVQAAPEAYSSELLRPLIEVSVLVRVPNQTQSVELDLVYLSRSLPGSL